MCPPKRQSLRPRGLPGHRPSAHARWRLPCFFHSSSSKANMASLWRPFDNYFSETLGNTNEPAYPPENVEQKLKMTLEVLLNFALSPSDDLTTTMPLPLWQP